MSDDTNADSGAKTEDTPQDAAPRGRPTKAELDARAEELAKRAAALDKREAELTEDQKVVELAVADVNLALREADLAKREAAAAGRSGSARSGDIRSEDITAPVRRRKYKGAEVPDVFHIPPEDIPVDTSYQWNNKSVFGQENPSYDAYMANQGWQPVPAERHPHLVQPGHTGPIVVRGQILMERPMELTKEAMQEDYDRARNEVRRKEEQLYGERPNTEGGRSLGITKGVEQGAPIPANYQYKDEGGIPVE